MRNNHLEYLLVYFIKNIPSLPVNWKTFIALVFPYAEIVEIVVWIGNILVISDVIKLFARWSVNNFPDFLYYGPVGNLTSLIQIWFGIWSCELFTRFLDCSVNHLMSDAYSLIPREYTRFILALASIVLTSVVGMKLFALPRLFKRRKAGWNLVAFASLFISCLFLVTLNIVGCLIYTIVLLYVLSQIKEYYT